MLIICLNLLNRHQPGAINVLLTKLDARNGATMGREMGIVDFPYLLVDVFAKTASHPALQLPQQLMLPA
jgi:hypothetical protein